MSGAEDSELRDLVSQILEENGVLAKIRAELRASVFLALEEQTKEVKPPFVNHALNEHQKRSRSALGLCLVREFLEYLQLDNTLAVFNAETQHGKSYAYKGRNNLMEDLHLDSFKDKKEPLLSIIVQIAQESLGSSNISAHSNEEHQAGDFQTNNQSPNRHVPSNTGYTETSMSSLDNSHNLLNQTFVTGAIVTSFGSPEASFEKHSPEVGYQTSQSKSQSSSEKPSQSGGSNVDINSKDSESGKDFEIGDSKNLSTNKKKVVQTTSTNPQTSLSNLPPLADLLTNKNHGSAPKSFFSPSSPDDNYEEDFSSESSGTGDKDSRKKSGKVKEKREGGSGPDRTSTKDVNSPVASVSEELEGDTNSVTDDVNSAASADTLDSSLSYVDTKFADHIEEV